MPPKQRRIAVLGFRSVGKSSLTIQFVEGHFVDSYEPTIENTFTKNLKLRGQEYQVTLVDTAGQDEYSIFPTQYSMDIHGYVLVYSIVDPRSLEVIQVIYDKLVDMTGKVNVPIVLVGNKRDLQQERKISQVKFATNLQIFYTSNLFSMFKYKSCKAGILGLHS